MVFSVRDKFDLARPVILANSSSELGASLAMTRSSSQLPADSTLANDSVEVNQTLGSSAAMRRAPPPWCETSSPCNLRCPLSESSWNHSFFAQHRVHHVPKISEKTRSIAVFVCLDRPEVCGDGPAARHVPSCRPDEHYRIRRAPSRDRVAWLHPQ